MAKYEEDLKDFLGPAEVPEKTPDDDGEAMQDAFGEEKPAPKTGRAKARTADKAAEDKPAAKPKYMPPPASATAKGTHRLPSGNSITNA